MARTKSSACSAMRISKTACRKKQDDRLQPGDGRFLYPKYNYTICNHEIFRRSGGFTLKVSVDSGRLRRPGEPPSGGGDKRGQGHRMVPLPPLDSPKPSFAPRLPSVAQRNGEKRGLGSVRRADFGTLSGPEVSLRGLPRITVRGHPVQSGSSPLRKAPLRSRV